MNRLIDVRPILPSIHVPSLIMAREDDPLAPVEMQRWIASQIPNARHVRFLPGLTIDQAAAGRSTLIAVVVGVALGAIVLRPSLALPFWLFLRGQLDAPADVHASAGARALEVPRVTRTPRPGRLAGFAVACLVVGAGLMVLGVQAGSTASLFVFAASAFVLAASLPNGMTATSVHTTTGDADAMFRATSLREEKKRKEDDDDASP